NTLNCYLVASTAYLGIGRPDDAEALLEQAQRRNIGGAGLFVELARSAILRGDNAERARLEELGKRSPEGELRVLDLEATHAAARGRIQEMRELRRRAFEKSRQLNMADNAATLLLDEATTECDVGFVSEAVKKVDSALALSRDPFLLLRAAEILAAAGQEKKAEALMTEGRKPRPYDTLVQSLIVPRIEARLQVQRGKPAAAVQTLAAAQPYENGFWFSTHVIRGNAYLSSGSLANAEQEFKRFLSRGTSKPFDYQYALAQLGLARALAAQQNAPGARTAYQDFFALWKDADPDIPLLQQAKAEYARLH
ncbi:MAG TPA: tetratricopeptide repeat protein, partial [Terriglobales bacterium]|nr:tetratricopeptide repeat protein [Terriglobales bacterium]